MMRLTALTTAVFAWVSLLVLPAQAEIKINEVTSPGGITAWLVEDHSIPFTALELRFRGGTSLDAPATWRHLYDGRIARRGLWRDAGAGLCPCG